MKKFLAFIIAFVSVLALAGVIKETKQGEPIKIYTNPSGTMTQAGEISSTGVMKINSIEGFTANTTRIVEGSYVGTIPEPGGTTPFLLTKDHYRTQIITAAGGDITIELPTTGIKKGDRWKIVNAMPANNINFRSSDDTEITTAAIVNGYVEFIALQDTPTAPSHWKIVSLYETYPHTTNFTGPVTMSSIAVKAFRTNDKICLYFPQSVQTSTVATVLTMSTVFPARLRTTTEIRGEMKGNCAGYATTAYTLATSGAMTVYCGINESNFASSGSAGWYGFNVCYYKSL